MIPGVILAGVPSLSMFGKRTRADPEGASPGKKLRANIVDLYSRGTISAQRCSTLLSDAAESKVASCQAAHSLARARDLQRGLSKDNHWPPLYVCKVPLKNKQGLCEPQDVALLLPHEVLHSLLEAGSYACIADRAGM